MIYRLFLERKTTLTKDLALDGLRGLAILLVVLSHTSNSGIYLIPGLSFSGMGKYGVYLFFILSSYLLDRQIGMALRQQKASFRFWVNYFARRFLRIFPLYILVLLLNYFGSQWIKGVFIPLSSTELYRHFLLQEGFSVFWSIPVEFIYYFFSPFIMLAFHYLCKWRAWPMFILWLLLVSVAILINIAFTLSDISTLRYLLIFLMGTGIAAFELVLSDKIKRSGYWDLCGLLCILLTFFLNPSFMSYATGHTLQHYLPYSNGYFILFALLWGLLLVSVRYSGSWLRLAFSWLWLRFIGIISFSLYLLHLPVIYYFRKMDLPDSILFVISLFLAVILSGITYLLIERPFMKIRFYTKKL